MKINNVFFIKICLLLIKNWRNKNFSMENMMYEKPIQVVSNDHLHVCINAFYSSLKVDKLDANTCWGWPSVCASQTTQPVLLTLDRIIVIFTGAYHTKYDLDLLRLIPYILL
jgi:hypothetical protein